MRCSGPAAAGTLDHAAAPSKISQRILAHADLLWPRVRYPRAVPPPSEAFGALVNALLIAAPEHRLGSRRSSSEGGSGSGSSSSSSGGSSCDRSSRRRSRRVGSGVGAAAIRAHEYFRHIDWDALDNGRVRMPPPPAVPPAEAPTAAHAEPPPDAEPDPYAGLDAVSAQLMRFIAEMKRAGELEGAVAWPTPPRPAATAEAEESVRPSASSTASSRAPTAPPKCAYMTYMGDLDGSSQADSEEEAQIELFAADTFWDPGAECERTADDWDRLF